MSVRYRESTSALAARLNASDVALVAEVAARPMTAEANAEATLDAGTLVRVGTSLYVHDGSTEGGTPASTPTVTAITVEVDPGETHVPFALTHNGARIVTITWNTVETESSFAALTSSFQAGTYTGQPLRIIALIGGDVALTNGAILIQASANNDDEWEVNEEGGAASKRAVSDWIWVASKWHRLNEYIL